jgi:hypothetical protein
MEYRQLITNLLTSKDWQILAANEFGRLAQGIGRRIKGTNTITFIPCHEILPDQKATYPCFVCSERPQKTKKIKHA